ncbi:MAG: hypothetical protein ACLFM0_05640 [Spirochaetales bacterium]
MVTQSHTTANIHLAFGLHLNFSDGIDSARAIARLESVLEALDAANERGVSCSGTWNMDQRTTLTRLAAEAPQLLSRIQSRVKAGHDDVVYQSWNGELVSAMTAEEFEAARLRAEHTPGREGLLDLFEQVRPIVRPPGMITSPATFDRYASSGMEAVCLFNSSTERDALRRYAGRLDLLQAHNPLRFDLQWSDLQRSDSGGRQSITVVPTYHFYDLLEHGGLKNWVRELHRRQRSECPDRDLLLFIEFDVFARETEGFRMPPGLRRVPTANGVDAILRSVEDLPYVRWTSLVNYLHTHDEVGSVSFPWDTVDAPGNGYAVLAESYESSILSSAVADDRACEAALAAIASQLPPAIRDSCEAERRVAFEARLDLLSSRWFDCRRGGVQDTREAVAAVYTHHERISKYLREVFESLPAVDEQDARAALSTDVRDTADKLVARIVHRDARASQQAENGGAGVMAHMPEELFERIQSRSFRVESAGRRVRVYRAGRPADSDAIRVILREQAPAEGISEGLSLIDRDGGLVLAFRGQTLLSSDSFLPVIGYNRQRFPAQNVSVVRDGSRSIVTVAGTLQLPGELRSGRFEWNLFETVIGDAPMVFIDGSVELPETACDTRVANGENASARLFDSRWEFVELCPLRIARVQYDQRGDSREGAVLSRRLPSGEFSSAPISYHHRFERHWLFSSLNNHAFDPYIALSVNNVGLAVGFDQAVRSCFAGIPVRAVDPAHRHIPRGATPPGVVQQGRSRVFDLNPLGTYAYTAWQADAWAGDGGRKAIAARGSQSCVPAASFNGRRIRVSLALAPFAGETPRAGIEAALSCACRPGLLVGGEEPQARGDGWRPSVQRSVGKQDRRSLDRTLTPADRIRELGDATDQLPAAVIRGILRSNVFGTRLKYPASDRLQPRTRSST